MLKSPAGVRAADTSVVSAQPWPDLIVRRCGLAFRHIRFPEVMGIVHDQMRLRGIADEAAYFQRLSSPGAATEWDALIERLTNHETSFFRHPPSFDALRLHILPELRASKAAGRRISLWSAGCSTGQEAYSMAMCAIADGRDDFTVWGSDISHQAITMAREGRFGPRAVATVPEPYRSRFFTASEAVSGTEFSVTDELRRRVRFMTTNLVEPDGFRASHDVVFCHNVLIYFSPAAVSKVVAHLASSVAIGGYLMLGPGEAPHDRPPGLDPVIVNGVRGFQRRLARPVEIRS
jgi:type IV pilus assembly protein PilK